MVMYDLMDSPKGLQAANVTPSGAPVETPETVSE